MTNHPPTSNTRGQFNKTKSTRFEAVVFDGDDTLWQTQHLYEAAKDRFEELCRQLGVWDSEVRERLDAIDSQRVQSLGFSPKRFPGSLVQTLNSYLSARNLPQSKRGTVRAWNIGTRVFRRKVTTQRGVRTVLRRLARDHRLILVTRGDRVVQRRRLRESGLARYFHNVYVVKNKTSQELRRICRQERVAPSRVLVVGDSLRSDVMPALEIGATAVWIPSKSWRFEDSKRPRSKRFIELQSVRMLPEIL